MTWEHLLKDQLLATTVPKHITNMSTIRNIVLHNSGGTQSNYYASSQRITWQQIDRYHKDIWNFPSEYFPASYGGYNFFYSPITRTFHQFRAIGEETAAQKGHNYDSISLCIGGNYSRDPRTGLLVDNLTQQNMDDIGGFIASLITGKHNYSVKRGTQIDLSLTRIRPHRDFQSGTECYGNGIDNGFFLTPTVKALYRVGYLPTRALVVFVLRLRLKLTSVTRMPLGALGDRSDPDTLPDNFQQL